LYRKQFEASDWQSPDPPYYLVEVICKNRRGCKFVNYPAMIYGNCTWATKAKKREFIPQKSRLANKKDLQK